MKTYLEGTNKNSCKNYGYRQLSSNGNKFSITSGNDGNKYDKNERCYWSIYAPGAQYLEFTIDQMKVSYQQS